MSRDNFKWYPEQEFSAIRIVALLWDPRGLPYNVSVTACQGLPPTSLSTMEPSGTSGPFRLDGPSDRQLQLQPECVAEPSLSLKKPLCFKHVQLVRFSMILNFICHFPKCIFE